MLSDHLGNARSGFRHTATGTASLRSDHYPFGLQYPQNVVAGTPVPSRLTGQLDCHKEQTNPIKNRYLYNGKELQDGMGVYDYGARLYDPVIGRWNAVDPLAEKYMSSSTYNYGDNNPILKAYVGKINMNRQILTLLVLCNSVFACKAPENDTSYRVSSKDSANFSVQFPELQPHEKIIIKLNDETILEDTASRPKGNPGFWRYYNYPKKIVKIEFLDFFDGELKVTKIFEDTLVDAKQRTLIVSRPYPKGMTDEDWKPYGFVSIDTGDRAVELVNDSIAFKDLWVDDVHEIK